ncbi:MAG: glycosyltransferase family 8 protein [Pseudomonadota bacterium]
MSSQALRIVLGCATDSAYAPHATTTLLSAIRNTPAANFTIYYLHTPDFSSECQTLIRQCLAPYSSRVEITFVAVPDEMVVGLPLFRRKAADPSRPLPRPVMWYRVFLPQLVPSESKLLYLDSDILVLDSLEELWRTDLKGKALAATANPFWDNTDDAGWIKTCGLADGNQYFNSGVMVVDLEYWRRHGITDRVTQHGIANASWTRFGDQDSLVAVLHDHWVPIEPRWNAMRAIIMMLPKQNTSVELFSPQQLHDAVRRPAIIHFTGSAKPWIDPRRHPYGRLYLRYARKLPWPVPAASWNLLDIENFLILRNWPRSRRWVGQLRQFLRSSRPK